MPEFNLPLHIAVNSHSRKLWFAAKRNFYFRDDPSRAALLCKQIIAQSALSEEADEAKLLLHDIRLDIRRLVGGTGIRPTVEARVDRPQEADLMRGAGMKIGLATAIVALPIIGIAQDGVIGIALPEIAALVLTGSLFWFFSKVRSIWKFVVQSLPR